jgi:hypothetical protein
MLGDLINAVVKTAIIPLAIVDDIVSMGDDKESSTLNIIDSIADDILS